MDKIDAIITSVLTAITIGLFAFILGRKKEEINIALNYQKYYGKIIDDQEKNIVKLESKISEQQAIIESQKENVRRWEANCEIQKISIDRLELLLKEERKEYQKLLKQLEK